MPKETNEPQEHTRTEAMREFRVIQSRRRGLMQQNRSLQTSIDNIQRTRSENGSKLSQFDQEKWTALSRILLEPRKADKPLKKKYRLTGEVLAESEDPKLRVLGNVTLGLVKSKNSRSLGELSEFNLEDYFDKPKIVLGEAGNITLAFNDDGSIAAAMETLWDGKRSGVALGYLGTPDGEAKYFYVDEAGLRLFESVQGNPLFDGKIDEIIEELKNAKDYVYESYRRTEVIHIKNTFFDS